MESTTPIAGIPRRDFLKRTAAGFGAGLVFGAPAILRGAANAPSRQINVALIGHGKQGQVLFEAMKNIPGLRFQAVCDIWDYNRKAAASHVYSLQKSKPNAYADIDEMLATEQGLDAAVIATPDFWHSPHTVKCLEKGLHVYCEKMMSNTIEGARAMVVAAEKSGRHCQIGHQRRSNPRYRFVLDELVNGNRICGQITNANGQWNRSVRASQDIAYKPSLSIKPDILARYGYRDMHQFMNWRFYRDLSGGAISDLGAHQIDIFNWFLGAVPKSLFATGSNAFFKNREHYDNIMVLFDYDTAAGPVRAFYQVLTTTSAGGGYYESFMGTEGTINISEQTAYTKIFKESSAAPKDPSAPAPEDERPLSWAPLLERGILALKDDGPPPAPPAGGGVIKAYASKPPEGFGLPGELAPNTPPHQPHLENFFNTLRGEATLTCDARHAFLSEAPIYYINPAAASGQPVIFTPQQLSV